MRVVIRLALSLLIGIFAASIGPGLQAAPEDTAPSASVDSPPNHPGPFAPQVEGLPSGEGTESDDGEPTDIDAIVEQLLHLISILGNW